LQELPQIHLHSYKKELLGIDKLIYSLDTKYRNYTRKEGLTANSYEMSLPINYSKYFLDDFLYANVENRLVVSKYDYGNNTSNYEDGTLIQNEFVISVGSDLIKPYDDYLHTINLNASYSSPKNLHEDGDLYGINNDDEDLSSFTNTEEDKKINLSINQSLYDNEDLKQIVNHKLTQSILYNSLDEPKLQDTENYIKLNYENASITNRIVYNVQDKQFTKNSLYGTYTINDFSFGAGYYKSKETPNSSYEDLESYNVNATYNIAKDYKFSYYENYNI